MIKKYLSFTLYPKLALWIILGFIGFTIIGTLTHELGHIAFAKAQGFSTELHYGSMNYYDGPYQSELESIFDRNSKAIQADMDFPEKERWDTLTKESAKKSFWVTLGGPFQTMLTGTIGFFFLYRRRKRIQEYGMKLLDWFLVFLTLFWLRETTNVVTGFLKAIVNGSYNPFGGYSDELRLARHLGWWEGSISLPLALIAICIAVYLIFKILPKSIRFTFISAGCIGGVLGYMIWLVWLGPVIMP